MSGDGYTFLGYPDGTFAATAHSHAGADVTSGTVATARLSVGTTAGTVAAGDDARFAATFATPTDSGLKAWAYPVQITTGGSALSPAGTLFITRIRRVPAGSVSNVHIFVTSGGGTLTSGQCFAGLWSAAGTLLSQTTDQAAAWASSGAKTMTLATPYTNPAVADLYAGVWYNGTTGPTLARIGGINIGLGNFGVTAPNLVYATANTGLTTTAPGSLGAQTGYFLHYWAGLS